LPVLPNSIKAISHLKVTVSLVFQNSGIPRIFCDPGGQRAGKK
jgi:hypothetical protein